MPRPPPRLRPWQIFQRGQPAPRSPYRRANARIRKLHRLAPRARVLHQVKDEADLIDVNLVFLTHSPKEIGVSCVIYP
jgi:hypothetical protein